MSNLQNIYKESHESIIKNFYFLYQYMIIWKIKAPTLGLELNILQLSPNNF